MDRFFAFLFHFPGRAWRGALAAGSLRLWLRFGAGVVFSVWAVGLVAIVWLGVWPADLAGQRLAILGWALWGVLILLAMLLVSLTGISVKASGPGGSGIELNRGGYSTADNPNPESEP